MKRIKHITAHFVYRVFPKHFCWADLAVWSVSNESFWKLFYYINKNAKGCVAESMGEICKDGKCHTCYCGCWIHGHHSTTYQGKRIIEKTKEETPQGLPF